MTPDDLEGYPSGLYDGRPPRVAGDETSGEAADSIESVSSTIRERVFRYIASRPEGAIDDEVEVALDLPHQTASARRRELVLEGRVEPVGFRLTRSGRRAQVWRPTPPRASTSSASSVSGPPPTLWDAAPASRDPRRFTR